MTTEMNYFTGEQIQAGDRVQYKGSYANVVFVSDGTFEDFVPGYAEFTGSERGVMICDDDGETTFIGEPDEMLAFVDRG